MDLTSASKILKINLKRNFLPHFLIALIIVLFTPVVFGISSLDSVRSAQPLEMLLSLTGTVILTPVFLPEQNENIRDLIRSKKTDYTGICIMRVIYSVITLALITGVFVFIMRLCESDVGIKHFAGGFTTALFLGSLGFCTAGISKNISVGYMVSMIYYIANFALKDKLGRFFIFSMSAGSFTEKYYLLLSSLVIIIFTLLTVRKYGK